MQISMILSEVTEFIMGCVFLHCILHSNHTFLHISNLFVLKARCRSFNIQIGKMSQYLYWKGRNNPFNVTFQVVSTLNDFWEFYIYLQQISQKQIVNKRTYSNRWFLFYVVQRLVYVTSVKCCISHSLQYSVCTSVYVRGLFHS